MIQKLRGTNQKGFTLIELMIVIAIIGILAAIAIPNFIAYRDKAFCSYGEQDAQSVAAAMASYFSEPDHTTTPSVQDLIDSEQLSTNNSSSSITIDETTTAGVTAILVLDDSNRCPRSTEYYKTMGGAQGYWQ
jgi:prepilin-type N-terminal cleavage/methylation domain-containing protein